MRRAAAVPPLILLVVLSGCAVPNDLSAPPPSGVPTPTATEQFGDTGEGDAVILRYGTTELHIEPMTSGTDQSGAFPADMPAITADDVYFFVRPGGWTAGASQYLGTGIDCGTAILEPEITDLGGGWTKISAVGPADTYVLEVGAGSGPGTIGGETGAIDAYVAITTSGAHPLPAASPSLDFAIVPGEDSTVTLAANPLPFEYTTADARADLTLTGDAGAVTLELGPYGDNCATTPGDVTISATLTAAQASSLGDGPYGYEITLELAGETYRAQGSTASQTMPTPLRFTPTLP